MTFGDRAEVRRAKVGTKVLAFGCAIFAVLGSFWTIVWFIRSYVEPPRGGGRGGGARAPRRAPPGAGEVGGSPAPLFSGPAPAPAPKAAAARGGAPRPRRAAAAAATPGRSGAAERVDRGADERRPLP